ncbi:C-type lectin domain family 4 member K [Lingula anatina]|uniref:C-type lectin domain family 4 member K n=1 Tax=Lingula anatina TaxID=7574 RepID=A0A1S3H6G5_LINAN|nr:C-type lectin domain family 4 member K [Lingula anatina]|eukprot:XP_013381710.1 C-type lectin domain family 4 member K [Lingula anatina]
MLLLTFLFIAIFQTGHGQIVPSTGHQPADHTSLLLQVQNYLLQLQSSAADQKQSLMDIQASVADLKSKDAQIEKNLTQQDTTTSSQLQFLQQQLASAGDQTANLTTQLKKLETIMNALQMKNSDQQILINTAKSSLDVLSSNISSISSRLSNQVISIKSLGSSMKQLEASVKNTEIQNGELKNKTAALKLENALLKKRMDLLIKLDGFVAYQSSWYKYISQPAPWHKAEELCQLIHPQAHLADILSQAENDFILGLAPTGTNEVFVGGHDIVKEGVWKWTTGQQLTYTKWNNGEPNSYKGMEEDCILMMVNAGGAWNDDSCDKSYSFVCKIKG